MSQVPGGNNVRALRKERGWSMEQLAEKITEMGGEPVHFTTIGKIERSQRRLTQEWMVRIAAAFGVPPSALIDSAPPLQARMVPVVGKIAAGNWREAILDPTGWVSAPSAGPNAFALRPEGDSMDRFLTLPDSWVVIDPDQRELIDGKLYAVMNNEGETTFKQLRQNPLRLEPCSNNPIHKTIPIGHEPFTIIGRAVAMGSDL